MRIAAATLVTALSITMYSGCSLVPPETKAEVQRADAAGRIYAQPHEKRAARELPADPTWQDVLQRAFLVDGDLEAAYWEWRAALERVRIAGAYPNSNVQVGFDYMFSSENLKAWNRTTISGGFDPSMTLRMPQKVQQAARAALAQAQAAGHRFENAKFTLQRKVLTAWLNYALTAEKVRIGRDNVALLELLVNQASDRVKTGAPQQDLLKAQMQHRLARNQLANMESDLSQMRAMLNGMLARPADAPLAPPAQLPTPRPVPADDATLIATAVDRNPELAALAADVQGRSDALRLAKMAYIPDVQPAFSITGNVSQAIGAMVMLPTAMPMIEGQIKEARAMLAAADAVEQHTRADRAAGFVAALYAMRNAERAEEVLTKTILPLAQQVLSSSRQAYSAGRITYVELIDSQRALLDVREIIAEVRIDRERRLVELEALAGVDIESLATATTTRPTTLPTLPATEIDHGK
jgi:outer membrane protein TolC